MDRRQFFGSAGGAGAALATGMLMPGGSLAAELAGSTAVAGGTAPALRHFTVTTSVTLAEGGDPAQLWLPVFHSDRSHQKLLGATWQGNAQTALVRDNRYGASLLHARWHEPATAAAPRQLTLTQSIATWERVPVPGHLSAAERVFWTAPAPGLPTDGIVADTARRILAAAGNPAGQKARLRALYDWVVVNTFRDPATPGCGKGDVAAMLQSGRLGGKCVDISGLMVALARASGLPARDVYGTRLAPSMLSKALGRAGGDITTAEHCRAEVWLDDADGRGAADGHGWASGTGSWFAVDPADVRKAILEDKLPADSAAVKALSEHLFGAWENNWAGYNSATGIALPGANLSPEFDFLMYPAAMTTKTACVCLDAAHFAYKITSQEAAG